MTSLVCRAILAYTPIKRQQPRPRPIQTDISDTQFTAELMLNLCSTLEQIRLSSYNDHPDPYSSAFGPPADVCAPVEYE